MELLWYKVLDLLDPGVNDRDTRHCVFDFLTLLVLGQYDSLEMMRPVLFKFIRSHKVAEDFNKVMELLAALTENGKDIVHIEEQVGPLLLEFLDCQIQVLFRFIFTSKLIVDFLLQGDVVSELLRFTSNMVKFNSAYMGQPVVVSLIVRLDQLSCNSDNDQEILLCLEIYKCIVMYSYVPPEALVPYISCLCKVVNLANISSDAWDTMRKLMGTHLGHSALYQLCQIIQTPENRLMFINAQMYRSYCF